MKHIGDRRSHLALIEKKIDHAQYSVTDAMVSVLLIYYFSVTLDGMHWMSLLDITTEWVRGTKILRKRNLEKKNPMRALAKMPNEEKTAVRLIIVRPYILIYSAQDDY